MAALFKYFLGTAIILSAMIVLAALNMGEIFVGIAAIGQASVTATPRWNFEHPKAEPGTPYIAHGSLSPIYPATPGKELLGKPVYTVGFAKNLQKPVSVKRIDVRQALQLHKVPRQIYAADLDDRNYTQQSLSYTEAAPSQPLQPRVPISFGHGIY
jgi:hypothetical protein